MLSALLPLAAEDSPEDFMGAEVLLGDSMEVDGATAETEPEGGT